MGAVIFSQQRDLAKTSSQNTTACSTAHLSWSFRCPRWGPSIIHLNCLFASLENAFGENTRVSLHFIPKLSQLQGGINVLPILVCDSPHGRGNELQLRSCPAPFCELWVPPMVQAHEKSCLLLREVCFD